MPEASIRLHFRTPQDTHAHTNIHTDLFNLFHLSLLFIFSDFTLQLVIFQIWWFVDGGGCDYCSDLYLNMVIFIMMLVVGVDEWS